MRLLTCEDIEVCKNRNLVYMDCLTLRVNITPNFFKLFFLVSVFEDSKTRLFFIQRGSVVQLFCLNLHFLLPVLIKMVLLICIVSCISWFFLPQRFHILTVLKVCNGLMKVMGLDFWGNFLFIKYL